MAKRKRGRGSIAGYFRSVFNAHPEWLRGKSNKPVLAQYRADHGMAEGADVPANIKANLANLKSTMRKAARIKSGKKAVRVKAVVGASKLEGLEELIDECLTLAKNLDRKALEGVISKLRAARNEVVWKLGN
jgi:hypothetical protein